MGVGASAGGLDACKKLFATMPADVGMAFILVQHLEPTHASMMVDLLAAQTALHVQQADDGAVIERGHVYVIPPGSNLAVKGERLHLSSPAVLHGARLPFDFLLQSLAHELGARAACIVLSGTGSDGSAGLQAVKQRGGLVIAQDPKEAGYPGMPQRAAETGVVDAALPIADILEALVQFGREPPRVARTAEPPAQSEPDQVAAILDLIRKRTTHDFTGYKRGTIERRIERRMILAGIDKTGAAQYLKVLRADPGEVDELARDLLINVTSFFRDEAVHSALAGQVIPGLVDSQPVGKPLRVWIAGCSTGEEAYSLAMLFREQISSSGRQVKLQMFASDVDADAVAFAREGLYPDSIKSDVSPARLARFFLKDDHGYRVLPELRTSVVFTVHDLLSDPPFSRLDLVSCRNVLIYLDPDTQARVMSLFDFALNDGGVLVLGSAETLGESRDSFEVIAKAEKLYRHTGRGRPGNLYLGAKPSAPQTSRPAGKPSSRDQVLATLCRQMIIDTYAPAAVLADRKLDVLYSAGPIGRYLKMAVGHPTRELLAMVQPAMRPRLRSAIQRAIHDNARVIAAGGQTGGTAPISFNIDVQPVPGDEQLLLVCFVEELPGNDSARSSEARKASRPDLSRAASLERELEATKAELQNAIRDLEVLSEDQKAVNQEALSVNEEHQTTNEELLTSKEELQSLNEELTALNTQLQETLERQRTTSSDLQNVLYSTDVATLFLDTDLAIRFFTPATKSLFAVIPTDVGRPLADLNSLAADSELPEDARQVLDGAPPIEREVEARASRWFTRRILPYRTHDDKIGGVVITFTDITERKSVAKALEAAKQDADLANAAKSRFLAAASHDLRQPLQTLFLLHDLLAKNVKESKAQELVGRMDQTLDAMSGMLNTLLDINRIEAGTVQAEMSDFRIDKLLGRLRDEFVYHAHARDLGLHVVPCSLAIHTDPGLLEQMIRNLLANAFKYTKSGRILLGCRRRGERLSVEIWDTGIGIPDTELELIFQEYHQIGNEARERSRGLGLGLSIVQRLGSLLGHRVSVRSTLGKGSMFAIDVQVASQPAVAEAGHGKAASVHRTGEILVVEDDPEVREFLELMLRDQGHHAVSAFDGPAALDLVAHGRSKPDIVIADYNLPSDMDGLRVAAELREQARRHIPVLILTGDTSSSTSQRIASQECVQLTKPVKPEELAETVRSLLAEQPAEREADLTQERSPDRPLIYVVDDDDQIRASIRGVLEDDGLVVKDYGACEAFLSAYHPGGESCLLLDASLPGMSGLQLLQRLNNAGHRPPTIMITGKSDVAMAVQAMKAGAADLIEKPVRRTELLASIARAIERSRDTAQPSAWRQEARDHLADLTPRQREIMELVLAGHPSKNIAADLGVSQRTVENHRASIMKKTGSRSLPALARLALAAAAG